MRAQRNAILPPELRGKISPALLMFAGRDASAPRIVGTGLAAVLGTAAFLLRDSVNWVFPSSQNHFLWTQIQGPGHWFWIGFILCFIGCYLALSAAYIGWGLTTWAKRESAHHFVK
jgi:hypothetical protein